MNDDSLGWKYCGFTKLSDYLSACPGEVGKLARAIDASMKFSQPSISLAAAFSFFAAISCGHIVSEDGIEPNLYCCTIAPSGSGKTAAQRIIKKNLIAMGLHENLMGEPVSGAALEKAMQENPCRLMLWDECGFALDAMSKGVQFKMDLPGVILSMYSAAGDVYFGKEYASRARQTIESPYLNIFACSTSQRFFDAIDEKFAHDGFLPRWLLFIPSAGEIRLQTPIPYQQSQALIKLASERAVSSKAGKGNLACLRVEKLVMPFGDLHRRIEKEFDDITSKLPLDSMERVFFVRAFENYSKLALVLGSYDMEATNEMLEYASELVRFMIYQNLEVLSQRVGAKSFRAQAKERFISLVKSEWMSHSKLLNLSRRVDATAQQKREWIGEALEAQVWEFKKECIGQSSRATPYYRKKLDTTHLENTTDIFMPQLPEFIG